MAARSSKKTQADLIQLVKAAGWQEDQKTSREWRWWHPQSPGIYYRLAGAAENCWRGQAGIAGGEREGELTMPPLYRR
ncbi:MAG: hypothetical protein LAO18_09955 [Acidobacteriia bacterium]|nr:hypothetical protein [Terriglobia bacterium]